MADAAKIVITAVDDTAAAFNSAKRGMEGVSGAASNLNGVIGRLAPLLGAATFTAMIKSSIDAADELSKLAQKTGTSVETLAGLKFAADQNGTSMESVANASKKLTAALVDKPEVFAKLGVTAKDSTGAMVQLADIFAAMPDGVEKTALAVKLMGKNGEEMIPFLNNGSAALRDLINQGKLFNPVTAESALQAQQFNDQLDALKAQSGALGISITNEMLPGLTQITTAMTEAAREGGLLKSVLVGIGGAMTAVFTDDMLSREQKITKDLAALRAEQMHALEGKGNLLNPVGMWKGRDSALNDRNDQMLTLEKELSALQNKPNTTPAKLSDSRGKDLLGALGGNAGASGMIKIDPNDTAVAAMQADQFRKQMELMGVSAEQIKVYELAMKGATRAQIEHAQAAADSISRIKEQQKVEKQLTDAHDESAKIIDKVNTASAEEMAQMRFETSLLGMNAVEVQKRTEARRIDLALEKELLALRSNDKFKSRDTNAAVAAEYKAVEEATIRAADATKEGALREIEARNAVSRSWEFGSHEAFRKYIDEATNAAAQSERLFTNAFKGMEDALVQFVRTGKLDFASLADNILNDLIRIQVQQSIMAPVMGAMRSGGGLFGMLGSVFGINSASDPGGNLSGAAGSETAAWASLSGARAGGGPVDPNSLYQVNEKGPEILNSGGNDYLMMGGKGGFVRPLSSPVSTSSGGTAPNVTIQVINQSGQNVTARQQGGPQADGRDFILSVVLEAADTNPQFRNAMGMGAH